jgi:hypothetical protein
MIVTPFGDLEFGDDQSLRYWMDAHDGRHHAERQAIARSGVPLFAHSYASPINRAWFGQHMLEHGAMKSFAIPDDQVSTVMIENGWEEESSFYKWHQIHNQLHQRLDQALGLS